MDLQQKVLARHFIAQEKRCDSRKEKTLLPLLSGSSITVFLCSLYIVLFASVVSLQAMKV